MPEVDCLVDDLFATSLVCYVHTTNTTYADKIINVLRKQYGIVDAELTTPSEESFDELDEFFPSGSFTQCIFSFSRRRNFLSNIILC